MNTKYKEQNEESERKMNEMGGKQLCESEKSGINKTKNKMNKKSGSSVDENQNDEEEKTLRFMANMRKNAVVHR